MMRRPILLLALAMLAAIMASPGAPVAAQDDDPPDPGPQPGAIGAPIVPLSEKRVYDMADLLTNGEEAAIESDAARLARHGIPAVVIVQHATMTPEQAAAFAAQVRQAWGVESAPGADDGLVILITAPDTEEEQDTLSSMSWGGHAFPHFGVNATSATQIEHAWLDRYIDEGYLYEGILFTLRRLIYHSIYDPAPQAPLTGLRATIGTAVSRAGPALALIGIALAAMRWTRTSVRRPKQGLADVALQLAVPTLAVALFALAVIGHSGWGVAAALALAAIAALDWVARDPRRAPARRVTP